VDIPFSELQEDLVQEERSYFSRRQGEYARLRTVPFVSPLISSAPPPQMSQAKANVTDDGSRSDERVCYNCGKVGHFAKKCPDTQGESGGKDQQKQEGTGNEKKGICKNFQRNGYCSYGKGCRFKHTRAPGAGTQNSAVSNSVSPGSAAASGGAAAIGGAAPVAAKGARLSAEEAARQIQEIMARVQCNVTTDVARPGTDLPIDWFADEVCDATIAFEPANGKFECADTSQGLDGFVDWFADEACVAIEVEASEDEVECLENIPGTSFCKLDFNNCVLCQGDQEAVDEADQDRDYSRGFSPCLIDVYDRTHVPVSQVSVWGKRDLDGDCDHHARPTERDNLGGIPLDFMCTPPFSNVPVSSTLPVSLPNLVGSAGQGLTGTVSGSARVRADARAPGLAHTGANGEVFLAAAGVTPPEGECSRRAGAMLGAAGEEGGVSCGTLWASCPGTHPQEWRSPASHGSHDPFAPPPATALTRAVPLQVGPTPPRSTVTALAPYDGASGSVVGAPRGCVVGMTPALRGEVGGAGGVIRVGAEGAADTCGVGAGTGAACDTLPGAARHAGGMGPQDEQGAERVE
jgi:hypothetical protein